MNATAAPESTPELVDWTLAARVGRRVAGGADLLVRPAWARQFTELSTTADAAVSEFTGLGHDLPAPVARPLDRGEWVEANLATLRRVMRPLAAKVATRKAWRSSGPVPSALRSSTRTLTGVQAGALLGYVGQRVLGQYDLPVPGPIDLAADGAADEATAADAVRLAAATADGAGAHPSLEGTVFYVVPNIVATERQYDFRPADFRLWIALHETAHRRQFRGVHWLPGHIQGLLDAYIDSVEVDDEALRRLGRRVQSLVQKALTGQRVELLDFLLTPGQRSIVDRVQATMTVLEGHGEFVMERLGARMVPGHERMRAKLHERRTAPGAGDRVIQQLLGLRQKLDQYATGERFIRRLYERGGMAGVNRVFAEPAALPTLAEVRDPDRYLARVG